MSAFAFAIPLLLFILVPLNPRVLAAPLAFPYATYQLNGKTVPHHFTTPFLNHLPKVMTDEERPMMKGVYLDQFYQGVNFQFYCPHYSFVTGIIALYNATGETTSERVINTGKSTNIITSTYKGEVNSHMFQVICSLIQSDDGGYVKKSACDESFSPTDNMTPGPPPAKNPSQPDFYDMPAGSTTITSGKSRCDKPQQFIHGISYIKYFDRKLYDDAFFKSHCCSISDEADKPLTVGERCSTPSTFPAGTSFIIKCGEGMVLKEITSLFEEGKKNRSFTFRCCEISRPIQPSPAAATGATSPTGMESK